MHFKERLKLCTVKLKLRLLHLACWTVPPCLQLPSLEHPHLLLLVHLHRGSPVSILRRSLGLPAQVLELDSPWAVLKGRLIWSGSCAEVVCFAYELWYPLSFCANSVLGSAPSLFSCARSDAPAQYGSDRFIRRTILVVLHVRLSLVVSSPANAVDMFQQHPSVSIMRTFKQQNKQQNMWHFQTQDHYKIFVWNKLEEHSESVEQIKTKQRVKGESFHLCKLQMESKQLRLIL